MEIGQLAWPANVIEKLATAFEPILPSMNDFPADPTSLQQM
jgi:hypothetical protein